MLTEEDFEEYLKTDNIKPVAKQTIVDRVTGKYDDNDITRPNPYIGACHIPDPINRDFCIICGKRITVDSTTEE